MFWTRIFGQPEPHRPEDERGHRRTQVRNLPSVQAELASAGILLVLRRMRVPLITLVVIFAVSVLGLSLVPGKDASGHPAHLSLFESFYFMTYTATTIGFGEIPYPFTPLQRMWVTFAIFLSVVGWAYAIGTLLSLLQDKAFRRALTRRRFARKVHRISAPFLLLVGYGHAAQMLARSLDDMGRRFVVVDHDDDRIAEIDLDTYRLETPVLHGDARETGELVLAGLGHSHCEGVVALTGDDDTNLDVTLTAALIRPDLPVIARADSRTVGDRMRAFHPEQVINPIDRFGDHLRILLRSPAAYQLMMWLTSAPGTPLPARQRPVPHGRWVVCGSGRRGRELTADLRAEGLDVTVVEGTSTSGDADRCDDVETDAVDAAHLETAAAVVAATDSDTTNLWLLKHARRVNDDVSLVAMHNNVANASLYAAEGVDFGMAPAEVISHEVLARITSPVLMRFLPQVPHQGEEWAARTVERLVERCGTGTPYLWGISLTDDDAPALMPWLEHGDVRVGDLLRSPTDRDRPLDAVALTRLRDGHRTMTPDDDDVLQPGDQLLIAGRAGAAHQLTDTMVDLPTATYVLEGRTIPSGWVWRRLSGQAAGRYTG